MFQMVTKQIGEHGWMEHGTNNKGIGDKMAPGIDKAYKFNSFCLWSRGL